MPIPDFNLQTFLIEMENRAEERHKGIDEKIDKCLSTVADHSTRLAIIEETPPGDHEARLIKIEVFQRNARWLLGTAITGMITAAVGWVVSHLPGSVK